MRNVTAVSADEITKAIKSINKGKSAVFHGITIEHIIFAGSEMEELLALFINIIFECGEIPEILKMGLLSPVYKKKGTNQQASNYRGITVLPVISKIIETIIKNRSQKLVLKTQNRAQRDFTTGSSPMNSALIVEGCYREAKDKNIDFQLILLDAKAAFDIVVHSHMLRRVFLAGIDNRHWTLIKSLHENAKSSVKWDGNISELFNVNQGVRPL